MVKRLTPIVNSLIKYVRFSSKKIYLQYKEILYHKWQKLFQTPLGGTGKKVDIAFQNML